ncbi:hypothetical protein SAMN02745121_07932 [Nannocystis exedens]|uniref:Uncharacterized protein n=1 Tax=Nannocystis exedens TaxID=54 RepID=A0A1I2HFT7_9BACT|nr:hypothetical protein [Nannocystis exedens]PCC70400.1 hypothetical protein NAEX_03443 [Nannocystis exedens]SFF28552.1 hypothetical protein SAMN02745121_07932 [Nannocystis exedens]
MARTRDLVALSAILVAPLAAILVSQTLPSVAVDAATGSEPPSTPEPLAPAPSMPAAVEPPPPVSPAAAPGPVSPQPTAAPVLPLAAGGLVGEAMLVRKDALVLDTHADLRWASGRAVIKAEPSHLLATRAVRWDSLPERLRGLAEATMIVHAADGSTCVAGVGEPRLHLEQIGDVFHSIDADGIESFAPPTDKAVLRDMVKTQFAEADDLLLLARHRSAAGRPCEGLWARRADLPPATVFGRRDAGPAEAAALKAEVAAVVRAQPEFAVLAGEYAEYLAPMDTERRADLPAWDDFVAANLKTVAWHEIGGSRQIVSVELQLIDRMACSDEFGGSLALLLERRDGQLVRLGQPGWLGLAALMDLEGDGVLEAVTDDGFETVLRTHDPNGVERRDGYSVPYIGCPC